MEKSAATTYLPFIPTTTSSTPTTSAVGNQPGSSDTSYSDTSRRSLSATAASANVPLRSAASTTATFRGSEYTFWNGVAEKIASAPSGYRVVADAKGYDRLPAEVMNALGHNPGVSLTINWNGGAAITIPAGQGLAGENRIYYPLSYLAEHYRQTETTSTVELKSTPATGGVWTVSAPSEADELLTPTGLPDITDYRRGLAKTAALAQQGVEQTIPGVYEPETTANTEHTNRTNIGLVVLVVLLGAATAGFWVRKRRQNNA